MSQHRFKDIITIAVITSMLIIESIDANILNIAIPTIANKLMVSPIHLKLTITSYLIGIAIFIPISGWISDKFGTKNTLLASIAGFCLASFLCGMSKDPYTLSTFRFFQGVSAAFMVPVARLLMLKAFPKEKLVKIYLIMSMPTLIGPLLSPLIGGFIVVHLSWPYIFFVNLPIGILAFLATYFYVDNYFQKSANFTLTAYICLALSIASLVYLISIALSDDFTTNFKLGLIVIFILTTAAYIFFEKKAKSHVINYSLFNIKTYKICFMGNLITRCASGGRGFIIALFLQTALHITPQNTSYLLACSTIGLLFSRLLIKKLLSIYGFKQLLRICNYGCVLSIIMLPFIHNINLFSITVLAFYGLFISMEFLLLNILCYADIRDNDNSDAVSLNLTMQQISTAIGVLIVGNSMKFFNFIFNSYFGHITFTFSFIVLAIIAACTEYYLLQLNQTDGKHLIIKKK